jgi:LmbE family N-acetylglucosaminyl deacetylase
MCAERGARVSLLCLTRGEHGPAGDGKHLSDVREAELRAAAEVIGISEVFLLDHEDGMLPWLDPEVVQADIEAVIRRVRPDVVVTFDADGLYWHPDHIAVHERTTAAVAAMAVDAPALRYVSIPAGAMRALSDVGAGGPILGVADVDGFGADAPPPSYVVDVGRSAITKLAALRCHRSQVGGGPLDRISLQDAERFLGKEHVRCAEIGATTAFIDELGTPLLPANA